MHGGREGRRKGCIRNSNRVFALFEIAGTKGRKDGRAKDGWGGRGGGGRLMKLPNFYEIVHVQSGTCIYVDSQ